MDALTERAHRHYSAALPYHNTDHVADTLDAAETLLERCQDYGVAVEADVVEAALLFHDAGYHRDHAAEGYDTKESYSAAIAGHELARLGYSDPFIDGVQATIMATRPDATATTPEQKVARAADLRGLMADYDTFRANAEALREEHRVLHGEAPDRDDWVDQVVETVTHYLDQEIVLTPHWREFHRQARDNLARFRQAER